MNLEGMTEPQKLKAEVHSSVLLGLEGMDIVKMRDDDIYYCVERSLTGMICLSKESELQKIPEEDESEELYKMQAEVLSVTGEHDAFYEKLNNAVENPPAYKGTDRWYKLLPSWKELQNIIDVQEEYMEICPDGELVQLLYNNYMKMAQECEVQGMDKEYIVYYYNMAAFSLLRRLEFSDYSMQNCYDMLKKLRNIYDKLSVYTNAESESGDDIRFNAIYRVLERYMNAVTAF